MQLKISVDKYGQLHKCLSGRKSQYLDKTAIQWKTLSDTHSSQNWKKNIEEIQKYVSTNVAIYQKYHQLGESISLGGSTLVHLCISSTKRKPQ